jgi:signal transduction histidine kinase
VGSGDPEPLIARLREAGIDVRPLDEVDALPGDDDDSQDPGRTVILVHGDSGEEVLRSLDRLVERSTDAALVAVAAPDGPSPSEVRSRGAAGPLKPDGLPAGAGSLADHLGRMTEAHRLRLVLRRTRRRLQEAEERFRNTVHRTADGIVIVDRTDAIRYVNPAAEALFRRDADQMVGEPFGVPLVTGETTQIDLMRGSGDPVVAELRVSRTRWEGEACRLVSLRDVTDRKKAEARARELIRVQTARREAERSAERSRFLGAADRELGGTLDPEQILESLAELTEAFFGGASVVDIVDRRAFPTRGRFVAGWPPDHPCPERSGPPLLPALVDSMRDGTRIRRIAPVPERWIRASTGDPESAEAVLGLRPVAVVAAPLHMEGAASAALFVLVPEGGEVPGPRESEVVYELAHRASLALENARLFRLARQASRSKSHFLDVVSHELRTPLTAIVGYGGLLREGLGGPELSEEQLDYLDGIERNSEALLRIIDQVLLFADTEAHREVVRLEAEPLADVVDDVVAVIRPLAERDGLTFRVERPPDPHATVELDPGKVRQILLHLLGNAVKFTESGSVELRARVDDHRVSFRVRDSGIGIAEEEQERIFRPFTQVEEATTRAVGGAGLGLNVVVNLVELLGGRLELESEVGGGSTFSVTLPRYGRTAPVEGDAGILEGESA